MSFNNNRVWIISDGRYSDIDLDRIVEGEASGPYKEYIISDIGRYLLNPNTIEIKKKLIKVGKDPSSDIVIGGLMTGKTAFTISKRPKGYYLSYVGGMAKPKVNDVAVKESILLNEFDTIEIASTKMQFIYKN